MKKRFFSTLAAFMMVSLLSVIPVQAAEWKQDNVGWWYQNDDGTYPVSVWKQIKGVWYLFGANGYMLTGWQNVNGLWYFLNADGSMAANRWEGNYFLGADGAMLTNTTTPDGYSVDGSGRIISSGTQTHTNASSGSSQASSVQSGNASSAYVDENSATVYWTPKGKSYHSTPNCRTLARSKKVYQGTLSEAFANGKRDPCNVCH